MTTAILEVAPASDVRWHVLLSGETRSGYHCLALRILMIRLVDAYRRAGPEATSVIEELRTFFRDNARFAGDDYRAIFGGAN